MGGGIDPLDPLLTTYVGRVSMIFNDIFLVVVKTILFKHLENVFVLILIPNKNIISYRYFD